jgi:hypothetical protein
MLRAQGQPVPGQGSPEKTVVRPAVRQPQHVAAEKTEVQEQVPPRPAEPVSKTVKPLLAQALVTLGSRVPAQKARN